IAALEADLDAGVLERPRAKTAGVETPELQTKRAWLRALRDYRDELREIANPKATPEERALAGYKKRVANRIAELQDKMDRKDFAPRKVKKLEHPEATKAKTDLERVKLKFEDMKEAARLKNRKW